MEHDRVGEKRMSGSGMEMEIIAYRKSNDIDVRFANGVIVKHRYYHDFKNGKISPVSAKDKGANRIGEKRMANCGLEMEIIAYRNASDIDVRFSNGNTILHRTYGSFKSGAIPAFEREDHTGEKKLATCGMEMEIIAYHNSHDVDVSFADGTILTHRAYADFCSGMINNPKFIRGKRIGEKSISTRGMEMEIIAYRGANDIDVRFSDGTMRTHCEYDSFKNGNILPPSESRNMSSARLGETRMMNCGMRAKITEYKRSDDITVLFEDGVTVEHSRYRAFLAGYIAHPVIKRFLKEPFHGVYVSPAFEENDQIYYVGTFPDGSKDICTLQGIMKRMNIPAVF